MNPTVKAQWLEALRSGKYKQTTRALCELNDDGTYGYCCLGVLCDIVAPGDWQGAEVMNMTDGQHRYRRHLSHASMPSTDVIVAAGLHHSQSDKLAILNDEEKYTFEQIADYIEQNL